MADVVTLRLIVTVKAYPVLSTKYTEAVCVAGVTTDTLFASRWVRLFPVQFRDLPADRQFRKWDEIEVQAVAHSGDSRPESYRPIIETLKIVGHLSSKGNWSHRKAVIDLLPTTTMCRLRKDQAALGTSLGMVTPLRPVRLVVEQVPQSEVASRTVIAGQGSLFDQDRKPLEALPFTYSYRYKCEERDCKGHEQQIADWELGQAFRKWRYMYRDPDELQAKIKHKWLTELLAPDRATKFFMGNMHQHPGSFLVLGVYYPAVKDL